VFRTKGVGLELFVLTCVDLKYGRSGSIRQAQALFSGSINWFLIPDCRNAPLLHLGVAQVLFFEASLAEMEFLGAGCVSGLTFCAFGQAEGLVSEYFFKSL
jgi:hypothetical protein